MLHLVDDDETECRDLYGHTHDEMSLSGWWIFDDEEDHSEFERQCKGCGQSVPAGDTMWQFSADH